MQEGTTRERIAAHLRREPATPSDLAAAVESTPGAVVRHVRHLARSLAHGDGELQVAPPRCRDCGFDDFDDPANLPSHCPACRGESLEEPVFRIAGD